MNTSKNMKKVIEYVKDIFSVMFTLRVDYDFIFNSLNEE